MTITILVVSVAVVFTVWVPVIMYRSAIRHGRSTSESLRLGCALVAVFAVWFGLSAGYTQVEALHDGPERPPWLVYLFFALIVIGPIAVARWSSLDALLADRRTLAELLITDRSLVGMCVPGVGGRRSASRLLRLPSRVRRHFCRCHCLRRGDRSDLVNLGRYSHCLVGAWPA